MKIDAYIEHRYDTAGLMLSEWALTYKLTLIRKLTNFRKLIT
jgi:hypothetical protein